MKHSSRNLEKELLDFITQNGTGKLTVLEEKYGVDSVRRLESIGAIENGLSLGGETWKVTEYAKRKANLSKKVTFNERCSGFINRHILGFDLRTD